MVQCWIGKLFFQQKRIFLTVFVEGEQRQVILIIKRIVSQKVLIGNIKYSVFVLEEALQVVIL